MRPAKHLDVTDGCVTFKKNLMFSASQELFSTRSSGFMLPYSAQGVDLWNIKVPDFSPKLYRTVGVPRVKRRTLHLPPLKSHRNPPPAVPKTTQKKELPPLATNYRPPDSLESRLIFVKTGQYSPGTFKEPRPPDFRPLAGGIPKIVTSIEKDPSNIKFKSQALNGIERTSSDLNGDRDTSRGQMDTFLPAAPKWESRLMLVKSPWPTKSASYTRHRRRRGVYSAFMDRVEQKLSSSWSCTSSTNY
ncbi:putative uncharacterized protein C7orf78 homolog [Denticeps clupeoides]|uniref:putative uncharacterized protein C7orf78 homolog n=1 Tax=Denticeps clupeoides TaxID=299321 RepID=UPI0010A2CCD6|nr:uncharacterized protein LOC114789795 [Denticeps clupeoides]